jgi:hypothetical protein
VHFLEPIQPQLKGIYAITLVRVFGDPGVALSMRTEHPVHQRTDDGGGPRRQLSRFQMHMDLAMLIRKGFDQIVAGLRRASASNCEKPNPGQYRSLWKNA